MKIRELFNCQSKFDNNVALDVVNSIKAVHSRQRQTRAHQIFELKCENCAITELAINSVLLPRPEETTHDGAWKAQ